MRLMLLCKNRVKGKKEKKIEKNKKSKTERERCMGLYKGRQKKENTNRRIDQRRRMDRTIWEYTRRRGKENYR